MDILSEVIGSIRAGNASARRIKESGAWGGRYPSFVGVGFHVVIGGTGWLLTRDGGSTPLRAGSVVLAPYGSEHGLSHTPGPLATLPVADMSGEPPRPGPCDFDFLCGCYRLDHGQMHRFLRDLPDVVALTPDYDRHPHLRSVTALLRADVAETGPGAAVTRAALLDLVLVHALRQWQEQSGDRAWPAISDPGVTAALRAIHGDPGTPWTVQRLSDIAGMSRTVFIRRFGALVGKPPMAYLTGWRLTAAARLLRETPDPLAAIARRVGYATEFTFASAFRREYGVAPGRFRQSMRPAPAV